jgi:hypothetical protein
MTDQAESQWAAPSPDPELRRLEPLVGVGRRRIALNDDGSLTVTWWIRDDTSAWSPWMTNVFTRTSS